MTIRTVAVLGAGHGGFGAAADLTLRGYSVRLYAPSEERLAPIRRAGGIYISGVREGFAQPEKVTTNIAEAVTGADLVMVVLPAVAYAKYAKALAPVLKPEQIVFIDPGHTCGGMRFVQELRKSGYRGEVQTCETASITHGSRKKGSPETAATVDSGAPTSKEVDAASVFVPVYMKKDRKSVV